MNSDFKNAHTMHVDAWIQQTTQGMSSRTLGVFFSHALHALWRRSSITLSNVTLLVIFERALIISKELHPLLSALKLNAAGVDLGELAQAEQLSPTQLKQAFRCLIIEVITIIGSLTAEILTEPLYQELTLITANQASSENEDREE